MTSLDEHMEEYVTEKSRREAEVRAAVEAAQVKVAEEYAKQRAAKIDAERKRQRSTFEAILAALRVAAALPDSCCEKVEFSIDELNIIEMRRGQFSTKLNYWMDLREATAGSRLYPGKRASISVGEIGKRRTFPQREGGEFAWSKIAERLLDCGFRQLRQQESGAAHASNKSAAEAFRARNNLPNYGCVVTATTSSLPERPIFVKIEWQQAMTAERAQEIVDGLRKLGILQTK